VNSRDRISAYLRALGLLCFEVSRDRRLLPLFVRIIALAPGTIAELRRGDQRRIAA